MVEYGVNQTAKDLLNLNKEIGIRTNTNLHIVLKMHPLRENKNNS